MAVYKEGSTWRAVYRYTDWQGKRKQTQKRDFPTKRDALAWEREQLNKEKADLDMTFGSFIEIYSKDMKSRLKENTWHTKNISSGQKSFRISGTGKSVISSRRM